MTSTSPKVLITILFLLSVVSASWRLSLKKTPLKGQARLWSRIEIASADELHVTSIQLGTGDFSKSVDAIFDTTTLTNWFLNEQVITDGSGYSCKTPCQFQEVNGVEVKFPADGVTTPLALFGNRVEFITTAAAHNKIGKNATDKVVFSNHNTINNISFLVPEAATNVNLKPNGYVEFEVSALQVAPASFGLGRPDYDNLHQTNFVDTINNNGQKLKQKGFSFYIHNTISQIIFGEPERFFGNHPQDIRNLEETNQSWKSKLVQLQVAKKNVGKNTETSCRKTVSGTDTQNYATSLPCSSLATTPGLAQPDAIFDSTTKFIYAPFGQLEVLARDIGFSTNGQSFRLNNTMNLYDAPCKNENLDSQFPEIEFYFFEVEKPFILKGSDYVTYDHTKTDRNCWLNFKPSANDYDWYLGTTFLQSNYCHFDQVRNYISCSPAFKFTPGDLHIGTQARIIALVVGALLLIAALAVIISLFTKVPPFQSSSVPAPSPTRSQNFELGKTKIERSLPPTYQNQPQFNPFASQFPRNY